jgi:two-component system response regulator DegU
MTVKILLVDDHQNVRSGLCKLIQRQPDWEVCAEAVDGIQAFDQAMEFKPDLVIMDVNLPRLNGMDATKAIMSVLPETKIIGLSVHSDKTIIDRMLSAGARGYVVKGKAHTDLIDGVKTVLSGGHYISPVHGND